MGNGTGVLFGAWRSDVRRAPGFEGVGMLALWLKKGRVPAGGFRRLERGMDGPVRRYPFLN